MHETTVISYKYSYDADGNLVSRNYYTFDDFGPVLEETDTYTYASSGWKDLLVAYNGEPITYDAIGNPLSYYGGRSFTWEGRELQTFTNGSSTASYVYNENGIRTQKTVDGVTTSFLVDGSTIRFSLSNNLRLWFLYYGDELVGFKSGNDTYYYLKNLQGDIIQIVDGDGNVVVEYEYDDWGKVLSVTGTLAGTVGVQNPFRYRGYYYDEETGLYYVSSRYYDPEIGRWINADNRISGVGENVLGYNMFAYCMNNPVNMSDPSGNWPKWIETAANWINNNIIQPVKNFFSSPKQSNVVNASSHDANRRPYNGEPGSTYTAPNGDSRTYGPDGTPEHDYDHDDHGRPDKHPHDPNGGHNHDWENGVRGPAYSVGWEPLAGTALVTVCVIGIVVVAADDATGIGVADDFLFGPLGAGVGEGLILIFG